MFGLLVFVHELGHFLAARRHGIVVEEFGFGFPPRLFSLQRRETRYSINLIPLGGFVRLQGESSDDRRAGSFGAAGFITKVKVLLAGVVMNVGTAYVILLGLCLTGLPPVIEGQFSLGTPHYGQPPQVLVASVGEGSPAAMAGLERGEVIQAANGQPLTEAEQLTDFTRAQAGQEVNLSIKRGEAERQVSLKLREPDSTEGFLGVVPIVTYTLRYGWWAPLVAAGLLGQLIGATAVGLAQFFGQIPAMIASLGGGGVPVETAAGPVGIVVIIKNVLQLGPSYLLLLTAAMSVSLAVFNVLPIPAIDGGRLAILAIQRLVRRQLQPRQEAWIHLTGFGLLILLMALVTVFDIRRL